LTDEEGLMARILLVDDDRYVLNAFRIMLQSEGFEVTTARSGDDAKALLKIGEFDAMVSDIHMTPVDGMELLKLTHELKPNLPVILLTGYASPGSAMEALKYGVFDYLIKPVSLGVLAGTVRRAVAQSNAKSHGGTAPDAEAAKNASLKEFLRSSESEYEDDVPKVIP
jgi:DNA-binding NtrC family response regulator